MGEIKQHHGNVIDKIASFDILECEECGYCHILPLPEEKQLEVIYEEEYYSKEKPLYLQRVEEDLPWLNIVYKERYEVLEGHLPNSRRRLLDVGSGPGVFVLCGNQRGWDTVGVEPSRIASEYSRAQGSTIIQGFFDKELVSQLEPFDAVHMSEVLEHIVNPLETLKLSYEVLKPDGMLCVVVPNEYNPFQKIMREQHDFSPWWLAPPHHINYFTPDSLKRLIQKAGFEIIACEMTFPIDIFLLMGENYIGNDILGRQCHQKRKEFEMKIARSEFSWIKQQLYKSFADLGIGREIVVYAKKS